MGTDVLDVEDRCDWEEALLTRAEGGLRVGVPSQDISPPEFITSKSFKHCCGQLRTFALSKSRNQCFCHHHVEKIKMMSIFNVYSLYSYMGIISNM